MASVEKISIALTEELASLVRGAVESGEYASSSEVIREALREWKARRALERKQIDGKGLIAVLKPIDEVITRIPVISSMVGGSLVGIPVRVTGSLERPHVTYLSPSDVGVELLNIPLRILGMPLGAMFIYSKWRPAR